MAVLRDVVEEALFEARPYVEYYDKLRETVLKILKEAKDIETFKKRLEEEINRAGEPFKTDLKIFMQKFEMI